MTRRGKPKETAVSAKVVQRVATVTDQEVTQLPPLYETIDPEALDTIINSVATDTSLVFRFKYSGHEVIIHESGIVRAEEGN